MHWLSRKIIKHKIIVLAVFFAVALLSLFLSRGVRVNYQMMDYLPEDSPSTVALEVMNEAFVNAPPNARVLVRDVTVPEALDYKQRLSEVAGVAEVTWLDDSVSLDQPLEMIEQKTLDAWYKDGDALFSLLIDAEDKQLALQDIRDLIGDRGALSGDAVDAGAAQESAGSEVTTMMFFIIPLILIILLLTTSSWFEPVLFLAAIGVAILINNGTNIIFGEISFVTQTTSSILQLAVSMDYSIFLLHRFAEYRAQGQDVKTAMENAMAKSFSSILASGLTTILGFAALMFMRFELGPDMGVVLAKGIVFSLLSVMFLLPVMTVFTYKIIDKTHHRSFLPSFKGLGKFVLRAIVPVTVMVAIVIAPAFLAQSHNSFLYGAAAMTSDESTQAYQDTHEIDALFGKYNQLVMLVPTDNPATEHLLANALYEIPLVSSVISYSESVGNEIPREFIPESAVSSLISGGYSRMILTVNTEQEGDEAFAAVEQIRSVAQEYYGDDYYFTGGSVNVYDMRETVTKDNIVVTIASIVGIGLIILLVMRSVSIPFILLLAIEASIWINLSFPYFQGSALAYIGFMIISSVQLGATVDYAILFANRYMENRGMMQKKEAIIQTVSDTTGSILTSASILTVAGLILSVISTNGVISVLGTLIGRGAALSALMVLFLLPALLYFCDGLLPKTTLGLKFQHNSNKEKTGKVRKDEAK